jgi:hypothetical protein
VRKYLPLQAISLFVVFIYGSLLWGVFPTDPQISWEGHLSGLVVGVSLAIIYRKQGPQSPKYMYEIEKELGIEPPDLEGIWREKVAQERQRQQQIEEMKKGMAEQIEEQRRQQQEQFNLQQQQRQSPDPLQVIYHYKEPKKKPSDDTDQGH